MVQPGVHQEGQGKKAVLASIQEVGGVGCEALKRRLKL